MVESINNANPQVKMLDNQKRQGSAPQKMERSQEMRMSEDKVSLNRNQIELATYKIPQKSELPEYGYSSLRELIVKLLEEQGITTRIASGDTSIDLRDLTPAEAQSLISEDGYWGVEQTSDRIVQFAISLAGNDPTKLEEMKAAIDKGFQMASKALGGSLPEISSKTYDAIMEKLDAWVASVNEG
ncbi:MAG: hypothetical protein JRE23_18990 [Deltaproteobacteria bacterium]|nr:hypothetical protein [Deltaproteobacteria bacterium]